MSEFFETHLESYKKEQAPQAFVHKTLVHIDAQVLMDKALSVWSSVVQNPKAAPLFSKLKPVSEAFSEQAASLNYCIDQNNAGILDHHFSEDQKEAISLFKEVLIQAAQKAQVSPEIIDQATRAFDNHFRAFEIQKTFTDGAGSTMLTALWAHYQDALKQVEHSRLGVLDDKALSSMGTERPYTEEEIKNKVDQRNQTPATGIAKYRNYLDVIKADDAEALKEGIEASKKQQIWGDEKEKAAQIWVWHAMEHNAQKCLDVLIDLVDIDLTQRNENGVQPIHYAAAFNKPEMIEFLIKKGISLDTTSVDGHTPLMVAASSDSVEAIERLVALGADVDFQSLDGKTALHFAATGGEDEKTAKKAISKLLELGANPTLKEYMEDALPEDYVDEESDLEYSTLVEARKRWENGERTPKPTGFVAKARASLGF